MAILNTSPLQIRYRSSACGREGPHNSSGVELALWVAVIGAAPPRPRLVPAMIDHWRNCFVADSILADAEKLASGAPGREGSSPFIRTIETMGLFGERSSRSVRH